MPKPHRLTMDIEPDLYKRLAKIAAAEERSVSKQGKILMLQALELVERKPETKRLKLHAN